MITVGVLSFATYQLTGSALSMIPLSILSIIFPINFLFSQMKLETINFGKLISTQTLLWYFAPWSYYAFIPQKFMYSFVVSETQLIDASFYVFLASVISLIFFTVRPANLRNPISVLRSGLLNGKAVFRYCVTITAGQIFLILNGSWGYTTLIGSYDDTTVSQFLYLMLIPTYAVPILISGLLANYVRIQNININSAFFLLTISVIILIQFFWFITYGRRVLLIITLLSVFILISKTEEKFSLIGAMWRKAYLLAPVIITSSILFFYYFHMRIAANTTGGLENFTVLDFQRVLLISSSYQGEGFRDLYLRPFSLLQSFAAVKETMSGYLFGWNFLSQFFNAIPSILIDKAAIGPTLENLWNNSLGVPLDDWSNTFLLESFIDFGVVGFVIYIVILHFITRLLFSIFSTCGYLYSSIFMCVVLFASMAIETSVTVYLATLRVTLVLLPIAFVHGLIKGKNLN